MTLPPELDRIVRDLHAAGFRALIAGGAVRDDLLGLVPKDFDVEIYGLSFEALKELLAHHGRIDLVGQSFGVIKLTVSGGAFYDFCLPRRDNKVGRGHRDFLATFDPSISPKEAASRRDFTINAMAFDPVANELLDYFGGCEDLKNHLLRATSDAFREDPLRVLRGMQFACRFNLTIDPATAEQSRAIVHEYSTIAQERVAEEFMKWAVKGSHAGRIAEYLVTTGWIVHFPEIANILDVPQDPEWHPEGDVGAHTMLVVDAAARIAERDRIEGDERAVLLFAALAHDFAKAGTTAKRERNGTMRWTAYGHEAAGGPLARAFLERIGIKPAIVEQVVPLVENHLAHSSLRNDVTPRTVRRLALRLAPANITQLIRLIEADHSGRPPLPAALPDSAIRIRDMAAAQAVETKPQPALILGRHVLPYFDNRPGPHIGEITRAAYEAQTDGVFSTEEEGLRWLSDLMSTR
jgi:tRNA nucleotidyltransferase (CCA-adding enzyme)